jgi:hypothetical protein
VAGQDEIHNLNPLLCVLRCQVRFSTFEAALADVSGIGRSGFSLKQAICRAWAVVTVNQL